MQTRFDLFAFVFGQWPDKDGRAHTPSAKGPESHIGGSSNTC